MKRYSRYQVATSVAVVFHAVGLAGMLFFPSAGFVSTTPFHLLLMAALLLYTQQKPGWAFLLFFLSCFVTGIVVEIVGTATGYLFGNYAYGKVLGPGFKNVPYIIGINWFIIIYCCGVAVHTLLSKFSEKLSEEMEQPVKKIKALSIVIDGATLAVAFDWLLEPVAVKLGYWSWLGDGEIPTFNYISWFVVSMLLLLVFHLLPFQKHNKFAIHLLLIQAMFFLLLRTFL